MRKLHLTMALLFTILTLAVVTDKGQAASSDYYDTVQKVYIGYYQRPADPGGLLFWAQILNQANGNLKGIIEAFATSPESKALYGTIDNTTIGSVVDAIYMALFNRAPDAGGKEFWVDAFKSGQVTPAGIMLIMLEGAQNDDSKTINNKVVAANLFTKTIDPELDGKKLRAVYEGNAAIKAARDFLNAVAADKVPTQADTRQYFQSHFLPTTPTGFNTYTGYSCIRISWDTNPVAEVFRLYASDSADVTPNNGLKLVDRYDYEYYDYSLARGTKYYYIVTAVNAVGESAPTAAVLGEKRSAPLSNNCDHCLRYCDVCPTGSGCHLFDDLEYRCSPIDSSYSCWAY
jgi:hypothetical protein